MSIRFANIDCLEGLRTLPDNSVEAVITDPPYGLSKTDSKSVADTIGRWVAGDTEYVPQNKSGFLGLEWDSFVPPPAVWVECHRVLKPGGFLLSFAGTRTQDLMGLSIRLAGFDIRDSIAWIYGSSMPKSNYLDRTYQRLVDQGDPEVSLADVEKWKGWGTGLKPLHEPIVVARKPAPQSIVRNVLREGVGGLNIDATRIGDSGGGVFCNNRDENGNCRGHQLQEGYLHWGSYHGPLVESGRFPSNVLVDDAALEALVGQGAKAEFYRSFHYAGKAHKKERPLRRNADGTVDRHPMIKPLGLMEWMCQLVVPEGGTVLDPFAGSGTTLQAAARLGFGAIGFEADETYAALIHDRLRRNGGVSGDPALLGEEVVG